MSRHAAPSDPRHGRRRIATAVAFGLLGLTVTGTGVYAALNAEAFNTNPQTVTSGVLSLTMADNGVGFSQDINLMAPGDVVNRYVNVTNDGDLAGKDLTLTVEDGTPTKLTTDATKGLRVTVTECVGGSWVVASNTGTCTGLGATTQTLVNGVALATIAATPASLVSGAISVNDVQRLRIAVTLPDQTETTSNGTLPAGTIQNLSADLTWTFAEAQRDATTTHS